MPRAHQLEKIMLELLKEKKPRKLEQLVKLVQERSPTFTEAEIVRQFLLMQKTGKVALKEARTVVLPSLRGYVFSKWATWFWIIVALSFLTIIAVTTIPENIFPIVYARYVFGAIYVLFLPGYCFVRAFFPRRELEYLEQIVLSLGLSILFVFLVGLLLNYSPWGITLFPIVSGLLTLTITFSIIALFREYHIKSKQVI